MEFGAGLGENIFEKLSEESQADPTAEKSRMLPAARALVHSFPYSIMDRIQTSQTFYCC